MRAASLNTFELHSATSVTATGCYIEEHDGLDAPSLRHVGQDRIGTDGYSAINSLWGGRVISITGHIDASDITTYNQRRRDLAALFASIRDSNGDPTRYTLKFTTDDLLEMQTEVVLAREPKLPSANMIGGQFFLSFIAPDPQIYSQSQITTSPITGPTGGGALLPWTLPVTLGELGGGIVVVSNQGTFYTWPVITLTGALTNPYLYNATTGKAWQLNYTSGVSDTIVIDMRPDQQTATLNLTQSVFDYVDPTSVWWWLEPGNNVINFSSGSSSDTGTMSMALRYAWLGT